MGRWSISFLPLLLLASVIEAHAQSATMITSQSDKQSYTFSNAAGFSITNNGSLEYGGPLNQLTGSPCCASATLTVNGQSTTISPALFEADTGLRARSEGGNTLSSQLSTAVMPADGSVDQRALQYLLIVGGPTRVGVSNSYTIQEKVDAQSLSIFPQFQPSVFP